MFELGIRIVFSLLVVFGLLWGLARLARRPLGGRGSGPLRILARQQLSRGASVAVVRIADKAVVLGITEAGVSLLTHTDLQVFEPTDPAVFDPDLPEPATPPAQRVALTGSALSPETWKQALAFLKSRS